MFASEQQISCYHDLLIKEYENMENSDFILEINGSRLQSSQIQEICLRHQVDHTELVNDGLLIDYGDDTFRTMHMDLIYRSTNARAAVWSPKIPLEFKLARPKEEMVPSFKEHQFEELDSVLKIDNSVRKILYDSLREAGYEGLAHHQLHYLQNIIQRKNKSYLLVSPTASGKSLIFYIAALSTILSNTNKNGTEALILYPRKALASDQLTKFLRVISILNEKLSKTGLPPITVGIDDGDTPRSEKTVDVTKNEVFRGVKCIKEECNGRLRYKVVGGSPKIVCERCNKIYDEIKATKGDIWATGPTIVFSNLSTLNRRLMTTPSQKIVGPALQWIVLDEAHVYREEMGGHVRWLLRRIMARFNVIIKGDIRFIISSATIYDPLNFVQKLLGFSDIYHEDYKTILEQSKEKKRKITINLILAPNPLRSAESLVEELSLLLGVWAFSRHKKAIVFIDNVSEVERLRDFVINTIIQQRQAQNDHIDVARTPSVVDISNSFSWSGLSGIGNITSAQLTAIYDHHFAELHSEVRSRIEDNFKNNPSGILFATSTMELGMDIGDIAAIIQYKVPITAESYTQRIGRAGRSDDVGRVAFGILVLTNSPSQIRYVLEDEYMRILEPEVDIPVAWENEEIKKQHVLYSILDYEAANNRTTYLDFTTEVKDKWFNIVDALNSLLKIVGNARNELSNLNKYQEEIAGDNSSVKILDHTLSKIEEKANEGIKNYHQLQGPEIEQSLTKLNKSESIILEAKSKIEKTIQDIQKIKDAYNFEELENYESSLKKLEKSLSQVLSNMEKIGGE